MERWPRTPLFLPAPALLPSALGHEEAEEFYARYHKRSNVESVNSAIKRKFGETLKSRNPTAQTNELLCKVLAYNLTVLIHEMHEAGTVPDFVAQPKTETPSTMLNAAAT